MKLLGAEPACALSCTLGEGLQWNSAWQRWCWTDIEAACLYTWEGGSSRPRRHGLPDRLGCFATTASGRLLLGLSQGLAWADWDDDEATLRVTPICGVDADQPATRVNDGRTDRSGRFVFGTLHEATERQPLGHFYQFSLQHGLRQLTLPPVRIANSICFSPDGGTMYFTDTPSGLIQQCFYDSARALVGTPQPFARAPDAGLPDGSVVDAEGCLWSARWGAGCVLRFSSDGALLARVQSGAPNVTCPAFGGRHLDELMFTTAREGLDREALSRAPASGSLWRSDPTGCIGLLETPFNDIPGVLP